MIAVILVLLALGALRDLSRLGEAAPWRTMDDFPDFYCAGRALVAGENPYRYEPLHACEHQVNTGGAFRSAFFASNAALAVPAPLPAYDFLPYMALAHASPARAAVAQAIAILAAVLLTALALWRLGISLALVAAALALSTAYIELNTGQVVPFALLALVLAGWALARGNDVLAGAIATFTALEPVVGLPVLIATCLFVPRARVSVLVCGVLFASAELRLVGIKGLIQYATAVLPAQAAAEVHFPYQYSLTYALATLGLPNAVAALAGAVSYALIIAAGVMLGLALYGRYHKRELLLFVPALCSIVGGTYVHPEELCFAIPALLVLATATRGAPRTVLALALCALAIPWILVWGSKQLFLASVLVCAVVLLKLRIDLRLALTSLCAVAAAIYALELHPPHLPPPLASPRAYAPTDLVQEEWKDYAEARSTSDMLWLAIKLPAWGALIASVATAACITLASGHDARRRPFASPSRGEDDVAPPPIL